MNASRKKSEADKSLDGFEGTLSKTYFANDLILCP